jgi:catechol 2,3-dioxygenase-like lactoylglutathione lyase family enzyme
MSRVQLALNVSDLESAIAFYSKLFGADPAKRRPGYANFAIADPPLKLVLMESPGASDRLNHLGVEVESSQQVQQAHDRLQQSGLSVDSEDQVTCCYAVQDKVWVQDPDGADWEIYVVLADSATFRDPQPTANAVCCA